MEGLEHGIANFLADPDEDLPPRSDLDYARKRRRIQTRLLWTRKAAPPIPGPLLFCRLAILRGVRLAQVPSDAQEHLAQQIAGGWAESPGVITGDGVCKLSKLNPVQAFWNWLRDLCQFAVEKGNFRKTLVMAARCCKAYAEKCLANGDVDGSLDSDGSTAQLMLRENTHSSCLFLGISKRELQLLFKFLPCVMEGKADEQTMTYLKDISNTLSVHL
ncbi:hypothetical protein GGI10_003268 [Coemansia sp. RSA 2530]|nr:hypothetical protein GGI10_003268 [Coemansia sp. RSA 2530]